MANGCMLKSGLFELYHRRLEVANRLNETSHIWNGFKEKIVFPMETVSVVPSGLRALAAFF